MLFIKKNRNWVDVLEGDVQQWHYFGGFHLKFVRIIVKHH